MALIQLGENPFLMRFILVSTRVNLGNQQIEIRIRPQGPLGDEFLPTRGALLVPRPESRNDTIGAETMQAFLRSHGFLEHIEADRAHELAVEAPWGDGDLGVVVDRILRRPVQFVQGQLPIFVEAYLLS